jgi:hypothetical protein
MFEEEVIGFFKRHNLYEEKMFMYLKDHIDMIDYNDEDLRVLIGTAYAVNKKNRKIINMRICIPYCQDEITALICIHEIAHGIYGYKKLNKKYNPLEIELLPMILERIYIEEKQSNNLKKYADFLDSIIDEESDEKYRFGLENRGSLEERDLRNFKSIDRSTRKLARRWKRNNR